ncbi:translation initiation factor IF-2-like [Camelus ferus]|uniref:Translation initiation factor IF-2-like n=1 Tax=Camelus ferus TaxID=419612 RepID=A0A8B8U373_CAMFR|nr:translation initiation factor IF-2-like [Camelus ferus]
MLRQDCKEHCIPSASLHRAPRSALPPRAPSSASQALLPSPAPLGPQEPPRPLLRACLPFPRLLWHPFLLFILPNWRPTPAAPQCAPQPVQQILRKARPALAQPPLPGGGRGRAGRRSRSPGAPRVSGADRAGWAGPPGGRAADGGRGPGGGGGFRESPPLALSPGQGPRSGPARRGQTLDVAKPPPPSPASRPGEGAQCPEGARKGRVGRPSEIRRALSVALKGRRGSVPLGWGGGRRYLMALSAVTDQTRSYSERGTWHFGAVGTVATLGEGSWHSGGQCRPRRSWHGRNSLGWESCALKVKSGSRKGPWERQRRRSGSVSRGMGFRGLEGRRPGPRRREDRSG